jgi:hypothetical protein
MELSLNNLKPENPSCLQVNLNAIGSGPEPEKEVKIPDLPILDLELEPEPERPVETFLGQETDYLEEPRVRTTAEPSYARGPSGYSGVMGYTGLTGTMGFAGTQGVTSIGAPAFRGSQVRWKKGGLTGVAIYRKIQIGLSRFGVFVPR